MGNKYEQPKNPLATGSIGRLIMKFAVPAIIGMLVGAIYNIVDQIFIGRSIGVLGNAATNVAFPLATIATATALLLGVGSASSFNLKLGAGDEEGAKYIAGNGISLMAIIGVILAIIVIIFLEPLIRIFGATDEILSYALTYTGITSLGIPFLIFSTGGGHLIRADGSPTYSMVALLIGAMLNIILDYIFIFIFDMGMAGAAWATVIGQAVSALIIIKYYTRFKTVKLSKRHFKPSGKYAKEIMALGAASSFNQLAMALVQITMNNTLTHYGSLSKYGSEIPLAGVGIISKVNIVFLAFSIGIAQGCQPIIGFNYGAKNYGRVKDAYKKAIIASTVISIIGFLCFQLIPRPIISIFGSGSEEYFQFAERYFRIFMMLTFVNGIQPITSNFFTSIGKSTKGIFLSLTRQILFLLPLIIIFPMFFGIDGVMYAGPIADGAAAILAFIFIYIEMKNMGKSELSI